MQDLEKSSFILYAEYFKHIKKLSIEQRGKLLTAILSYASASGEEQPELDAVTDMIFGIIKERMDRDFAAYMDKVEKRRNAGALGGRPKKANGFPEKQKKAYDFSENQAEAKEPNGFPEEQEKAKKANGFSEKQKNPDTDNVPVLVNNKNTLADAKATFERLWKLYPNKKGKGKVSDAQKKRLLAIGESTLVKAIERYSLELQKDADWRKAQYGSTFFNGGYIDYLDNNYVPGEQQRTQAKKNAFNNFSQRTYDYDALEEMLLQAEVGG